MKTAIFTETFLPMTDGVVTRLTATINHLLQLGEKVIVFAPGKGENNYHGAPVIRLPGIPLFVYPEKKITFPHPAMTKALQDFKPDLIHSVNPVDVGAYGIYYARKYELPLVCSYHTNTIDYLDYYKLRFLKSFGWKYIKWLHNQSSFNLCTSEKMQQELQQYGMKRVYLWEKGVDTEKFNPDYASREMRSKLTGGQPDKILFLYIGRLGFEKEIEKIRPALDNIPGSCLALVGDGPARSYLEKVFAGTDTVFTGYLHGEQLSSAYASADIFVMPSTTETLGLVVLEAMASGVPAIVVDNGPPSEIVDNEISGLHFSETGNPDITRAMTRLAGDEALRKKLARGALKTVREKYNWRKPTEQLLGYYKQAIEEWQGKIS